jgi:hypothetical protein
MHIEMFFLFHGIFLYKILQGTFRTSGSGGEIQGSEASEEQDLAPELEAKNQLGQGVRDNNAMDNAVRCDMLR